MFKKGVDSLISGTVFLVLTLKSQISIFIKFTSVGKKSSCKTQALSNVCFGKKTEKIIIMEHILIKELYWYINI